MFQFYGISSIGSIHSHFLNCEVRIFSLKIFLQLLTLYISLSKSNLHLPLALVAKRLKMFWNSSNNYQNCPKNGTLRFYNVTMHPKSTDGKANKVDPDQTVPLAAT